MKRPSNWVLGFISAFIIGVFIQSFLNFTGLYLFFLELALIFGGISLLHFFQKNRISLTFGFLTLILIASSLGILRTEKVLLPKDNLEKSRDTGEIITFIGTIVEEPDIRDTNIKYTVLVEEIDERILITAKIFPELEYKDRIKLSGKLETPKEFPEFNYREFLIKDKIHTVLYDPEIELIEKKNFSFYQKILDIKNILRRSTEKILPYPYSEILKAMMLGDTSSLPQDVKDIYKNVGLSHILAISGSHITIIAGILFSLLNLTRFRKKSFYIILSVLIFYIVLIGYPASAVRAGIMAGILLLGEKLKRPYFIERGLLVAAFLMLIINPLFLRYDIGFQLSFLAVLGISQTQNIFKDFFNKFFRGKLLWFQDVLAITLAAQIYTLPLVIYNFGFFSLFSPLVNILVVPTLPMLTILSFIAIFAGVIWSFLGILLALPVYLILVYIQKISIFFGSIHLNSITIESLSFFWVIILYLVIGLTVWRLKKRNKRALQNSSNQ
ncbi:MAG: ComEC/Rec2 family competence protein [Patescibacteria group bacterium]|mgnify:CR=1 FL=1